MALTITDRPHNLMRLGTHLEKQFFCRTELYDVIVVNANVVEAFPAAIAGLLASFPKPFVIDPITYGFAMPPQNLMRLAEDPASGEKERKPKRSFLKLGEAYLGALSENLSNHRPSQLRDLLDPGVQSELCERVVRYQSNRMKVALEESDDSEYLLFETKQDRGPSAVMAPYFYMVNLNDGWFELNLSLIEKSAKLNVGCPVYAMICFEPELLDGEQDAQRLGDAYSKLDVEGYFLWLNNFEEPRAPRHRIEQLISFLKLLRPKPIYNAYGGYLSETLALFGMTGTCHGPGYGEFRDVLPVGGGVPTAQYYVRPLKQRLVYPDAEVIVPRSVQEYLARFCACDVCVDVLKGDMDNFEKFGETKTTTTDRGKPYTYSTIESMTNCSHHYLNSKSQEFESIRQALASGSSKEIVRSLREDADLLEPLVSSFGVKHLRLWAEILATYGNRI